MKVITALASSVAALAMLAGTPAVANATVYTTAQTVEATDERDARALIHQIQRAHAEMKSGGSQLVAVVNGYDLYAQQSSAGVNYLRAVPSGEALTGSSDAPESEMAPASFCVHLVTAGIFALGAAVIGAAAATGGIVIAGFFIQPATLGLISGAMGSYAAVQSIVAAFIC